MFTSVHSCVCLCFSALLDLFWSVHMAASVPVLCSCSSLICLLQIKRSFASVSVCKSEISEWEEDSKGVVN